MTLEITYTSSTKLSRNMSDLFTVAAFSAMRLGFPITEATAPTDDQEEGAFEPRPVQPRAAIDEQRSTPADDHHGDVDPVRLQLKRQIAGQRVPPDRDEHDHQDQRSEDSRPRDEPRPG